MVGRYVVRVIEKRSVYPLPDDECVRNKVEIEYLVSGKKTALNLASEIAAVCRRCDVIDSHIRVTSAVSGATVAVWSRKRQFCGDYIEEGAKL